ncbi:FkbM family methyltransferase [Micromonospora sp. FIMYZ51]|uniref:FkbM family methyltransferase n=1 Tax=Micromonospora sp. FIMYZ51 TaxID=3051832 RepID=UPI00311FB8A7
MNWAVPAVVRQSGNVIAFVWSHPANRGARLGGLARAVRFQLRGRMGLRTLTRVGSGGRMWAELHYHGASKVAYVNPPDWNEMLAWRRILQPGDLFVDVGSNVGAYALFAADAGAEVIAIEPSRESARRLRENVALNDFPVSVLECGLADRPGELRLTTGRDTTNHLLLGPDADGEVVAVDTLDNVLGDRFAVGVKIDVEGVERLVLDGAREALRQHRIGVLQIEWNGMSRRLLGEDRLPIAALLEECGYQLVRPDERGVFQDAEAVATSAQDMFAVLPEYRSGM